MSIKYKLKKLRVKLKRYKPKRFELTDVQQKAYDTTMKIITDKESELVIAPISGKRIIKRRFLNKDGEDESVFITLNRNNLHIVNGIYHYDIYIDDRIKDDITNKFNAKLERKINVMENQIKSNVIKSLDDVIDKVNKSK